jgi:uncharacterized protein YrrD
MTIINPGALIGAVVTGADGDKLGKIEDVYYDHDTDRPEWAAVKSGLFPSHVSLIPLANARQDSNGVQLRAVTRRALK